MKKSFVILFFVVCFFTSCISTPNRAPKKVLSGFATYNIDEPGLRAAHADLEFDTRVRVINLNNQQAVIVTITDRIPFDPDWVIHVGKMAGDNIGMSKADVTPIKIEVLGRPKYPRHQPAVSPSVESLDITDLTDSPGSETASF
jgi:rare lipoprotein A